MSFRAALKSGDIDTHRTRSVPSRRASKRPMPDGAGVMMIVSFDWRSGDLLSRGASWWDTLGRKPNDPVEPSSVPLFSKCLFSFGWRGPPGSASNHPDRGRDLRWARNARRSPRRCIHRQAFAPNFGWLRLPPSARKRADRFIHPSHAVISVPVPAPAANWFSARRASLLRML